MNRRREDRGEATLCDPDAKEGGGELAASGGARPVRAVTLDQFGLLCAVLAAVGFSGKAILVKLAYRYGVDAETLLALRMAFSLPFFLGMAWIGVGRAASPLTPRDWGWLCRLGLLGYYLASYLDFLGLRYISAGLERLILFVYPTLVVLLAALWLGQPLTRRMLGALALCYAGIALALAHDLRLAGAARRGTSRSAAAWCSAAPCPTRSICWATGGSWGASVRCG